MGFAALRLASVEAKGFLRSLSSRGTFQGVLWKAARPIERKIRRITRARRSLTSVFGFFAEVGMDLFPGKVSHRWGLVRKSGSYASALNIKRGGGSARGVRR